MGAYESSYKSLLQGVSQQVARERQPGQVSAQENMLSDVVTNCRRRPGAAFKFALASIGATATNIKAYYLDVAGQRVHVLVNTSSGTVYVLDQQFAVLATLQNNYLISTSPKSVQVTALGDDVFLLNREKIPASSGGSVGTDPKKVGCAFVVAGAFTKKYTVVLTTSLGTATGTYTTPTGAAIGDAALSTPDYIATQLATSITASAAAIGVTVSRIDAYLGFVSAVGTNMSVTCPVGSAYMVGSKDQYFTIEGNLPALLPAALDQFIVRVGDVRSPKYFQYSSSSTAWLECGSWDSPTSITDMPISLEYSASVWSLNTAAYEGRLSGDSTSNPIPRFVGKGITGMGTYQGRLVLLSGPLVLLSASNLPRRFMRSTVTSILDSDPISIGAGANSSAAYEYAVPFQKDLLLFSESYQALVPSTNTAITPRTATCLLTSTYNADMTSCPVTLGRTLMYPTPRSESFFGVLEMVPSSQVDSQYVSGDATAHLPKYMAGTCRFSVSSSTSGTVLFAPSGDKRSLIVHEYMWSGEEKVQQAWHRWTFPYDVAAAYFVESVIVLVFVNAGQLVGCSIDPRAGVLSFDTGRKPYMDLNVALTITGNTATIPAWMTTFDPSIASKLSLGVRTGSMAGERIGFSVVGSTITTVRSYPEVDASIGIPYLSALSPTPPMVKDDRGVVISTMKVALLRYVLGTANSSEYDVRIKDAYTGADPTVGVGTLYWSSTELALNRGLYATESLATVPCRTNAATTSLVASTSGLGELNLISMEYILKFNPKIKRMREG